MSSGMIFSGKGGSRISVCAGDKVELRFRGSTFTGDVAASYVCPEKSGLVCSSSSDGEELFVDYIDRGQYILVKVNHTKPKKKKRPALRLL